MKGTLCAKSGPVCAACSLSIYHFASTFARASNCRSSGFSDDTTTSRGVAAISPFTRPTNTPCWDNWYAPVCEPFPPMMTCVDPALGQVPLRRPQPHVGFELRGAGGAKHRAALLHDPADIARGQRENVSFKQARAAGPDAEHFKPRVESRAYHSADRRVHARRIPAACEHGPSFQGLAITPCSFYHNFRSTSSPWSSYELKRRVLVPRGAPHALFGQSDLWVWSVSPTGSPNRTARSSKNRGTWGGISPNGRRIYRY